MTRPHSLTHPTLRGTCEQGSATRNAPHACTRSVHRRSRDRSATVPVTKYEPRVANPMNDVVRHLQVVLPKLKEFGTRGMLQQLGQAPALELPLVFPHHEELAAPRITLCEVVPRRTSCAHATAADNGNRTCVMSIITRKTRPAHASGAGDRNGKSVMSIFTSETWPAHVGDAGDSTGHCMMSLFAGKTSLTGCFFGIGALVFEKVLSCETRGPTLRNRGPIQRNSVSLDRTSHFLSRKIMIFAHVQQHLNAVLGSLLIATFLLAMNGPRSVITCSRCSTEVTTGSYQFQV